MGNMVKAIELQDNELNDVTGGGFMDAFLKAVDILRPVREAIGDKVGQVSDVAELLIKGPDRG